VARHAEGARVEPRPDAVTVCLSQLGISALARNRCRGSPSAPEL